MTESEIQAGARAGQQALAMQQNLQKEMQGQADKFLQQSQAEAQINQMINFIISEAQDKEQDIKKKGDEEFSIEVHRLITEQKEKVRQNYERKVKQIETQYAINKSMAINKQRLEKIKARQEVMMKVQGDVRTELGNKLKSEAAMKPYVTKLIVQGLLMFLEDQVDVTCRQADVKMVESCLADAESQYKAAILKESGANKTCKLTVHTSAAPYKKDKNGMPSSYCDANCLGGVILACQNGKITIDNTIDLRLKLVMEQDKPAIRSLLFPQDVRVASVK